MIAHIDPRTVLSHAASSGAAVKPDRARNHEQLRQSTREFEAIYINEMYKAMRKTVPDGGLFKKSMSSELFQEMLDMEMARSTAAGNGMGIGLAMYNQLKDHLK